MRTALAWMRQLVAASVVPQAQQLAMKSGGRDGAVLGGGVGAAVGAATATDEKDHGHVMVIITVTGITTGMSM